jgi:tetratricopeptide (TPR) repeat protein
MAKKQNEISRKLQKFFRKNQRISEQWAIRNRGYTGKTRLRGLRILDFLLVRAGGLGLCRREFDSPRFWGTLASFRRSPQPPFKWQGCFILVMNRPEINFWANSSSPLKRTKRLLLSRLKPTSAMRQGIHSLAELERMKQPCFKRGAMLQLFLIVLLFIFSATITPVIASNSSISVIQAQQNTTRLTDRATNLYRSGKYQEAVDVWNQAVNAFAAQKDSLNQAMALSNLSLTYQNLGQWELAKKAIADSLALLKTQSQTKEEQKILAQTLDIQGNLQREMGQTAEALKTWQSATKIYEKIAPNLAEQSKINQAQAMQDLGLYSRACKTLLEVLNTDIKAENCQDISLLSSEDLTKKLQEIAKKPRSLTQAVGLRSLGELLRLVGQPERSLIFLETSLSLAQKFNSPADQAAAYLSIGNTAQTLSETERIRRKRESRQQQALAAYDEVVKLSPSPTLRQQAQLNQLTLWLRLAEFDRAAQLWRSLSPQLSSLSPSHTGVYQQLNFAQSLIKLMRESVGAHSSTPVLGSRESGENAKLPTFDEIKQILIQATTQAINLGDRRAQAYALGYRGGLYELQGKRI